MRPVTFEAEGARLIAKATRETLAKPRANVRPGPPPQTLTPNKVVLTSTTIGPGSGATPGSGSASLQVFDGTTFQDLGVTVTVFNLTSSTIASGAYVQVVVVDGFFFYDVTDCKNGS